MLPPFYQKVFRSHLSEAQYLTLMLLVMLIQSQRQIQLARLASAFPQPIQYNSRIRNLQRFLILPQLSVRLLWFPILKYWLRQEVQGRGLNRDQRRHLKKLKRRTGGTLVLALDRTQWKGRNLLMVTVVWGNHALPVYWQLLPRDGSNNLNTQVRLLSGYNLEQAKVHDPRFLALVLLMVIAYSLATCSGQVFKQMGVERYVARLKEDERRYARHSEFGMGLYGYAWCYGMKIWPQWAWALMQLKPHKQRFFQQGLEALHLLRSTL